MKRFAAIALVVAALGACAKKEAKMSGADTTVTNAGVKDTLVVKKDTTITTDTTKKTDHKP